MRAALEAYRDGKKFSLTEWQVLALLFPARGEKPFVIAPEFSMAMTCNDMHTTNLVREKSLPQMRETKMRAGRNGAAVIAWSVVIAFLRERRLGGE